MSEPKAGKRPNRGEERVLRQLQEWTERQQAAFAAERLLVRDGWYLLGAQPEAWQLIYTLCLPRFCRMTGPDGAHWVRSPHPETVPLGLLREATQRLCGWKLPELTTRELSLRQGQQTLEPFLLCFRELIGRDRPELEAELALLALGEEPAGQTRCTAPLHGGVCGRFATLAGHRPARCRAHGG